MSRRSSIWLCCGATLGMAGLLVLLSGCRGARLWSSAAPAPKPQVESKVESAEPGTNPTTAQVTARDPDLMLFGADPGRQVTAGQPEAPLPVQQQTFSEVGRDFDPDVDAAGKLIVFASTRHSDRPNLYLQNVHGKAVTQLTDDPAGEIQPRLSPDGKRVAFASDRAGQWDIYVLDLDSRAATQVTRSDAPELAPSWSPDGKWLAYSRLASQTNAWELWLVNLEDGVQRCISPGLLARWSPDGKQLTFQRARERDGMLFGIWTLRLDGGEPGWPTEIASEPAAALIAPTWSPDGKQLAFCRVPAQAAGQTNGSRPPHAEIWTVGTDGSGRMRLTDGGASFGPCWAADGRIFFSSDRDGRERIWSLKLGSPVKSDMAASLASP